MCLLAGIIEEEHIDGNCREKRKEKKKDGGDSKNVKKKKIIPAD